MAHSRQSSNMVAEMITLLMMVATSAANSGPTTHVEARATATIQRGIVLKSGTTTPTASDVTPVPQRPRDCIPASKSASDCRLIVYDLP